MITPQKKHCFILFIKISVFLSWVYCVGLDVEYVSVDSTNGSHIVAYRTLRIKKINRTFHVMDGSFETLVDFDNTWKIYINADYSSKGNNQWVRYPMKIAKQGMCDLLNNTYRDYQEEYKNNSNLPQVGPEGMCPLKKNVWHVDNFVINPKQLPPYIPEGLWRLTSNFEHNGVLEGIFSAYFKVFHVIETII